jgi:hypothetical protein
MLCVSSRRILAPLLLLFGGCAMCPSPYDYDYAAQGGRWERHDPVHGRVGSAFEPSGAMVVEGEPITISDDEEAFMDEAPLEDAAPSFSGIYGPHRFEP